MQGRERDRNHVRPHGLPLALALTGGLALLLAALPVQGKDYQSARTEMVQEIVQRGVTQPQTLAAMRTVPREAFVPLPLRRLAYSGRPLPIGHGQTISTPYIVGFMTDVLKLKSTDRVLEIGTGSGYQAAVLSRIVSEVFTIEIVAPLAQAARTRLRSLGYTNIVTHLGDGYYGWPDHQPFDAIIVTAAASHIPPPLVEQLQPGGRMIIPVGSVMQVQHLLLLEKDLQGKVTQRSILPVRFVPLTGGPRSKP